MSLIKRTDVRIRPRNGIKPQESFLPLLIAISLLLILIPLFESVPVLFTILASFALITGMLAVYGDRWYRVGMAVFLAICLPLRWIVLFWGNEFPLLMLTSHAMVGLFFVALEYFVISRVVAHQDITHQTVIGAICGYLLIGVIFTFSFAIVTYLDPDAITIAGESLGTENATNMENHVAEFAYFSFITLTTVGYGDIVAVNRIARMLVVVEALAGQLYLAAFVARFVGLMSSSSEQQSEV